MNVVNIKSVCGNFFYQGKGFGKPVCVFST